MSRELGVSETTVQKWAKRDGWVEAAEKADADSAARVMQAALKTIEQRNADTIKLTQALRDRAINQLEDVDVNVAVRALPRYLAIEQLLAGEATARVEVGDVQAIITAVFTVAGRFVPAERRGEFMEELDGAVGGLVVIDGGRAAA